ncbi:MAG: hypothetical protein ACP5RD_05900 [bacterium]
MKKNFLILTSPFKIFNFITLGVIFFYLFLFFYNVAKPETNKEEINVKTTDLVSDLKTISFNELEANGFSKKDFYVMGFNENNEFLLARDKVKDPQLINEGKPRIIATINTNNLNIQKYFVSIASIEQYLNLNNNDILVLGNSGNFAGIFNIKTGNLKTIIKNEKGKKGFRFTDFILKDENKIYVEGYFFDENQIAEDGNNYWVEFNPNKTGLSALGKKVTNTTEIVKKLGQVRMFYWATPNMAIFTRLNANLNPTELWAYYNSKLYKIDTQEFIIEIALSKNGDALYLYKKGDLSYFSIYNLKTKNKIEIAAPKGRPFLYPFISNDGNIAIVSYLNIFNKKMDFMIGFKDQNYKLNDLVIQAKMGSFKLSSDGSKFSILNDDGLIIGNIKK